MKLGIVGTSWISAKLAAAASRTTLFEVVSVYSRTLNKGIAFVQKHAPQAHVYTGFTDFLHSGIDVVYIASPNSYHFEQTMAALAADVHVIVEKPAFLRPIEYDQVAQVLATKPHLLFFEAAKHTYLATFKNIKRRLVDLGDIQGGQLTYMTQTPYHPEATVWSLTYGRGVLYDLGVYLVYDALAWFGVPEAVRYQSKQNTDQADFYGVGALIYDDFTIDLHISMRHQSHLASEIYGTAGTLRMNHPTHFDEVTLLRTTKPSESLVMPQPDNTMLDELQTFGQAIKRVDRMFMTKQFVLAQQVGQTLYDMRQQAGLVFPGDATN